MQHPDGTTEPLAIAVPGDRDIDAKRLEALVYPSEVLPFTDEDFARYPHLAKGYIGPGALGEGDTASGTSSTLASSKGRHGSPEPTRPAST